MSVTTDIFFHLEQKGGTILAVLTGLSSSFLTKDAPFRPPKVDKFKAVNISNRNNGSVLLILQVCPGLSDNPAGG